MAIQSRVGVARWPTDEEFFVNTISQTSRHAVGNSTADLVGGSLSHLAHAVFAVIRHVGSDNEVWRILEWT